MGKKNVQKKIIIWLLSLAIVLGLMPTLSLVRVAIQHYQEKQVKSRDTDRHR